MAEQPLNRLAVLLLIYQKGCQAVPHDEVRILRSNGASLRQIAEKLGVGYGTVRLRLRNA